MCLSSLCFYVKNPLLPQILTLIQRWLRVADWYGSWFPGEQHTYKCLSCPFSSMTISQLKEHSLRDHGEALTLPKLRAATQAAHAALRPSRLAGNTEQTPLAPDGNNVILIKMYKITWWACRARFGKSQLNIKADLWFSIRKCRF